MNYGTYRTLINFRLNSKWRRVRPPSDHAMLAIHNCDLTEQLSGSIATEGNKNMLNPS